MGVGYVLINRTKNEAIYYHHLPVEKAKEIAGNTVSSAITTWYMLNNINDDITFIPDTYQHGFDTDWENAKDYKEVTDTIIDNMIANGIFVDEGIRLIFDDEPDLYFRKIRNIWDCPT